MIEGDVILQGQGTPHQKLIPVMAQPPRSESDLQLVDWLDRIKYVNKGIKLDFSSIDALEISLQRLQEFNIQVRVLQVGDFLVSFHAWIIVNMVVWSTLLFD